MQSNRLQIIQLVLTVVLVGLLIGVLGTERGPAPVSAAQSAQAVPGGPGFVMVPAAAFQAGSTTSGYHVSGGDLSVPVGSPNGYSNFYAPVYLPQGARLTGLTLYYHDTNNDAYTLGVEFLRKPLPSASWGESVGLSVISDQIGGGLSQSDTTPTEASAVVDNSQYAYWLAARIDAAPIWLNLQAVRIDYTFSVSLPAVFR